MLEKSALFSFARRNESALSLLFCLVFCPSLSKNFGKESAPPFRKKDLNRKKKKIGHRRDVIGCEINRTHLAETANDCADKANIVCGIECNI